MPAHLCPADRSVFLTQLLARIIAIDLPEDSRNKATNNDQWAVNTVPAEPSPTRRAFPPCLQQLQENMKMNDNGSDVNRRPERNVVPCGSSDLDPSKAGSNTVHGFV